MAQVTDAVVTLRIFGDHLDPALISDMLGQQPTGSDRKGDIHTSASSGSTRVAKTGSWRLSVEERESADINLLIEDLLASLNQDTRIWKQISKQFDASVSIGIFMSNENEGFDLKASTLSALAERRISVSFDMYSSD